MSLTEWPNDDADSYYNVAAAQDYFDKRLNSTKWTAADTPTKEKALQTITNVIDRETWQGTKFETNHELQFSRSGLTDKDGNDVPEDELPPGMLEAVCEGAIDLLTNSKAQLSDKTSDNIKEVDAKGVSVEFFHSISSSDLPNLVFKYLHSYLEGSGDFILAASYGTENESTYETFDRSRGFF